MQTRKSTALNTHKIQRVESAAATPSFYETVIMTSTDSAPALNDDDDDGTPNFDRIASSRISHQVTVCHRKPGGQSGFTKATCVAVTCDDLIEFAKPQLAPTWTDLKLTEDPSFLIFEVDMRHKIREAVRKEQDDVVKSNCVYTIYESWLVVPTALYRKVELVFGGANTYTHPDLTSARAFTEFSPLSCAAMKSTELELDFHTALSDGVVEINGMSLDMQDDATPIETAVHPLGPIRIGETKGVKSMSLDQAKSLLAPDELLCPQSGILTTSLSHRENGRPYLENLVETKMHESETTDGQVTKRMAYWRCLLEAGVDLRKHGMMLILDNFPHFGHCSMVRTRKILPAHKRGKGHWISPSDKRESSMLPQGPYLSQEATDAIEAGENIHQVLREIAFAPASRDEPDAFFITTRERVAIFPTLASQFIVHDIVMESIAELQPPKQFATDQHRVLYNAVNSLSQEAIHYRYDPLTFRLVNMVEDVDYDISQLSSIECSLLTDAFDDACGDLHNENDRIFAEAVDNLRKGKRVLRSRFKFLALNEQQQKVKKATDVLNSVKHASSIKRWVQVVEERKYMLGELSSTECSAFTDVISLALALLDKETTGKKEIEYLKTLQALLETRR